jgi:hypothetical protein
MPPLEISKIESMKIFVRLRKESSEAEGKDVKSPNPALKRVASTLMDAAKATVAKEKAGPPPVKSTVPSLKRVASTIISKTAATKPVSTPTPKAAPPAPVISDCCVDVVSEKSVKLVKGSGSSHVTEREYDFFDKVFGESATNDDVYANIQDNVFDAVKGFNSTIFTYGQMMSGIHSTTLVIMRTTHDHSICTQARHTQ